MAVETTVLGLGFAAERPGNQATAHRFPGSSRMDWMPLQETVADEELLKRAKAEPVSDRRERLIQELFQRYHQRVAVWCLRLSGDRESAADLAQDVFLKAFTALDSFQGKSKFSTWLYSIARNHCFNFARSASRNPAEVEESVLARVGDDSSQALFEEVETRDSRRAFRTLVDETLTETEKKVMVLHFVDGLPLAAVTAMLGLDNRSGSKAYVVSAKRKLKKALQRWKARSAREGSVEPFPFSRL